MKLSGESFRLERRECYPIRPSDQGENRLWPRRIAWNGARMAISERRACDGSREWGRLWGLARRPPDGWPPWIRKSSPGKERRGV